MHAAAKPSETGMHLCVSWIRPKSEAAVPLPGCGPARAGALQVACAFGSPGTRQKEGFETQTIYRLTSLHRCCLCKPRVSSQLCRLQIMPKFRTWCLWLELKTETVTCCFYMELRDMSCQQTATEALRHKMLPQALLIADHDGPAWTFAGGTQSCETTGETCIS